MAMPVAVPRYTVDDLDSFPDDGNRYELLDGVLPVSPAPSFLHEIVVQRISHPEDHLDGCARLVACCGSFRPWVSRVRPRRQATRLPPARRPGGLAGRPERLLHRGNADWANRLYEIHGPDHVDILPRRRIRL